MLKDVAGHLGTGLDPPKSRMNGKIFRMQHSFISLLCTTYCSSSNLLQRTCMPTPSLFPAALLLHRMQFSFGQEAHLCPLICLSCATYGSTNRARISSRSS